MGWFSRQWAKLSDAQKTWAAKAAEWAVVSALCCVLHWIFGVYAPKIPLPPLPGPPPIIEAAGPGPEGRFFGWTAPSDDERTAALKSIKLAQGVEPDFRLIAGEAIRQDDNASVFFWDAEAKVLGKVLDSWNQGSIGSCVSHGWGRGCQDLLLIQIANGAAEEWPGAEVNREAIYGGSRVQVGGGRISGDGSTGAWAAQWVQPSVGGLIFNLEYPSVDLTGGYSVSRCGQWGRSGCPKDLVPVAQEHAIKSCALVKSSADVWAAIGNGYPVPVCSGVGFDSPLQGGFCSRRGSWPHCMTIRGRFTHSTKGKCFVIQNSWGDYLRSDGSNNVIDTTDRGKITLPIGCFAVTSADIDSIVREQDSYAVSAFKGFPAQKLDWFAAQPARIRDDMVAIRKVRIPFLDNKAMLWTEPITEAQWQKIKREMREPEFALAP